jgi:uncharacterized membrane protein YkoI
MKINRFIALALIALLVVGAMGFITARGLAHGSNTHLQQVVATQAPDTGNTGDQAGSQSESNTDTDNVEEQVGEQDAADTETDNAEEQASDPTAIITDTANVGEQIGDPTTIVTDTTNVEEQVGEQVEDGQPDDAETPDSEAPGAPDEGAQDPSYTGSVPVDQSQTDGMSEADESAALQAQATISAADAEAAALAANPGTTVIKTEFDNENGVLVYSVELSNGSDVKVDAGNGSILFTDNEGGGEY